MKHAHDITLILPEHISLSQFEDIIALALKNCNKQYQTYHWEGQENHEVETNFNIQDYSLKPVAAGDGKLIMEFEYNES